MCDIAKLTRNFCKSKQPRVFDCTRKIPVRTKICVDAQVTFHESRAILWICSACYDFYEVINVEFVLWLSFMIQIHTTVFIFRRCYWGSE